MDKNFLEKINSYNPENSNLKALNPDDNIYRTGSGSYMNLTPRDKDRDGLSYMMYRPKEKCTTVTIKALEKNGTLYAINDHGTHVSVRPTDSSEMQPWIDSRPPTAKTHPYHLTVELSDKSEKLQKEESFMELQDILREQQKLYQNQISQDTIDELTQFIKENDVDYTEYFSFKNCKTKFAVINLVKIASALGYPRNEKCIDFLFECLQDVNWPFFIETVDCLRDNFPRDFVIKNIETSLTKAMDTNDFLWIGGINYLVKELEVDLPERMKEILKHSDF